MLELVEEVEATLECGIYVTALLGALTVVEACAAVEHDGLGNVSRFTRWYDDYVECPTLSSGLLFDGYCALRLRNGLSHDSGTTFNRFFGFERVAMIPPTRRVVVEDLRIVDVDGVPVLQMDLTRFIGRILAGARLWHAIIADDAAKMGRLGRMIQLRRSAGAHVALPAYIS